MTEDKPCDLGQYRESNRGCEFPNMYRDLVRLDGTSRVRIVDDEPSVYDTINQTDCLRWPNAATKTKGGADSWGQWRPKKGDIGVVLGASRHCSFALDMYILSIDGHIAAVPQYQTKPDL